MKIIIANWKVNPRTLEEAKELFRAEIAEAAKYENVQTVICPPFVYLEKLSKMDDKKLGMQDFDEEQALKNTGVTHALVGHSDRRYPPAGGGDTDEIVNGKIKAALTANITPVLLVGERNRDDNKQLVLERQLSANLAGLTAEEVAKVLITYEPVWAISTTPGAEADTPENTLGALEVIKESLAVNFQFPISNFQFLYGGSINSKNVADFLKHSEISGAVVGGASLRKDELADILRIVSEIE